jgi:nucleoside-diphosphate-sugar epimerase
MAERLLVTGANGCIGAWVVAELTLAGAEVVALDVSDELHRLALVLGPEGAAAVPPRPRRHRRSRHARADDRRARHVDEVPHPVAPAGHRLEHVHGPDHVDPRTERGIRPAEGDLERGQVDDLGDGRDRGVTSAPTAAMLAAAAGRPYHIPYGGRAQMQYTLDVAPAFIAAAGADATGASVHNLAGEVAGMDEIVAAIEAAAPEADGLITHDDAPLAFPRQVDAASFSATVGRVPETPLAEAIADTVARFRVLLAEGLVAMPVEA